MSGTDRYDSLEFNAPMTSATADEIVHTLASSRPRRVLDIGCGWAELLLRILDACPHATGQGIDNDEAMLARARRSAGERSLLDRVSFSARVEDAECGDLVLCIGAEHVWGSLQDALAELGRLTDPGGRVLVGSLFWEREPSRHLEAEFGPLPTLDTLIASFTLAGWRPLSLRTATLQDWDCFEFGFMADWELSALSLQDAGQAADARDRADRHRTGYLQRRGILGFAFVTAAQQGR
jgi:ubiquinone/menaquinone biosynthesis C-methylase UbiE